MKQRLKIGLDFHGVINRHPEFFSGFCNEALRRGHEIHILTGGPENVVSEMLRQYKVPYSKLFAILDFYEQTGKVTHYANGEFKVEDKLWNRAKAEYCLANGINLHIDDSSLYGVWFQTPFCRYDGERSECVMPSSYKIDLRTSPSLALDQIEELLKTTQYF